jgi:Eukaryotic aspartyl protease
MDGISVNHAEVGGSTAAIIDTGTTLVLGDQATVEAVYKSIPGSAPISGKEGYFSCKHFSASVITRSSVCAQIPATPPVW